jgi:hypothetical protein
MTEVLGEDLSQSKITDFNLPLFEHDVGRLEISMDELCFDYRPKTLDDLIEKLQSLLLLQPLLFFDVVAQVSSVAILHH